MSPMDTAIFKNKLLLLFCLFVMSLCTQCNEYSPSSVVSSADSLVEKRSLQKAIVLYQKAIQESPKEIIYHLNQGALFRRSKEFTRANHAFAVAKRINPRLFYADYGKATISYMQKNYSQALGFLNFLSDDLAKKHDILAKKTIRLKAKCYIGSKDKVNGEAFFKKIFEAKDINVDWYLIRAEFYESAYKDKSKAINDYKKYIELKGPKEKFAKNRIDDLERGSQYDF